MAYEQGHCGVLIHLVRTSKERKGGEGRRASGSKYLIHYIINLWWRKWLIKFYTLWTWSMHSSCTYNEANRACITIYSTGTVIDHTSHVNCHGLDWYNHFVREAIQRNSLLFKYCPCAGRLPMCRQCYCWSRHKRSHGRVVRPYSCIVLLIHAEYHSCRPIPS